MRPLSPKMVPLLGAFLLFAMAPLCVVADAMNGTIEHHKNQIPPGVLLQPPPFDQVVKSLEGIPIASVHIKKLHGIPESLAPGNYSVSHRSSVSGSSVLAHKPHPSQPSLHFREELRRPKQLVSDPTLIQKPSSSAGPLSGNRLVKTAPTALSPSKDTARVEKRDVKLSGSQYGDTPPPQALFPNERGSPNSPTRGAGGATESLKPYVNRVFKQLPHLPSTRTWTTRTAPTEATSKGPHRHGFHKHQHPVRPSPSSSSPLPSRPSWIRRVLNTRNSSAADAAKKGYPGQWVAIGICACLVVAVFLYLLIRGIAGERKDREQARSAANGKSNNNGGAGHDLQSLRNFRPVSITANTNAVVPNVSKLPSTFINPLSQHPPTPPRASRQWGGMHSVGQVGGDRNLYTYPSAPDHPPPAYTSLSRAESTINATCKVPTTSSGLLLTTLSKPVAPGNVSRSSSIGSSSTLFDTSNDARVKDMLVWRSKKNKDSWESWNNICLQDQEDKDGVEEKEESEMKKDAGKKRGASRLFPKWPTYLSG